MMMMGIGHLDVFDVIQKWVGKNVPGAEQEGACVRQRAQQQAAIRDDDYDHGHGHR